MIFRAMGVYECTHILNSIQLYKEECCALSNTYSKQWADKLGKRPFGLLLLTTQRWSSFNY